MSGMYGAADERESIATIQAALDAGITLLDTGDYYGAGHNELLIGRALRDRRDKALLSVKFGALRGPDGNWLGMPFEEIASIVGRSVDATRQLASRARRRVRGGGTPDADLARQREVVEAFVAALRAGDFEGLLAVLDPDLVVRADMPGAPRSEIRGAAAWAKGAISYGHLVQLTQFALVNGAIGVVVAPKGRLVRALSFTIANGKITKIEVIGNPARLSELDVSFVD